MDLNIIYNPCPKKKDEEIIEMVKRAFKLGYETVAINTIIDSEQLNEKNVKIPDPPEISDIGNIRQNKRLKILTRLTAIIKDGIHGHHLMQCPATKKYDLVAVRPIGEKMLHHVCSNLDVDIISMDLGEKLSFSFKRTYIGQAREKDIVFEIEYSPVLRDQSTRRWVISNAQILSDVSKYKNIIISSGALHALELRGVSDVINLSYIFGLNPSRARTAVVIAGTKVLSHSSTRRKTGCGYVSIQETFKLAGKDRWLLNACRVPKKTESSLEILTKSEKSLEPPPLKKPKHS